MGLFKKFEKVEVIGKQIGQNFNVVIGDRKATIKGTKESLQPVKDAIKAYQEKPSAKTLAEVEKHFKTEESAKKADIKAAKEKVEEVKKSSSAKKETVKKASQIKTAMDKDVKELGKVAAKAPAPVPTRGLGRRGEY